MSGVHTIFNSTGHPEAVDDDYEVSVAIGRDGMVESVAVLDYEMCAMVEMPPEIARLVAQAILDKVPPPRHRRN